MKKWEKEILQKQITSEYQVVERLKKSYDFALEDVKKKILELQSSEQTQSVIYQIKYQQQLQSQLEEITNKMGTEWYSTTDEYLKGCYEDGFYGTMYSLHQEGIPLVMPINQEEMVQMAAQSATTGIVLSNKIYDNAQNLARISREEITRGLATGSSYADIARNLDKRGEASLNGAYRIARTEGHRVHEEVKQKTTQRAKEKGADVVKQWDSTIDKRTRPHHTELDGQIRELDAAFKIPSTGATAQYPGGFGIAAEDIHCRCTSLQRARWALDKSKVDKYVGNLDGMTDDQMQELADKLGVSKEELISKSNGIIEADGTVNHSIQAKNYNEFKKKYQKKEKVAKIKEAAKAEATSGVFSEEAYGARKATAVKNRFKTDYDADKYYRPQLDEQWDNISDNGKYATWEYTHNSNPMNKVLSGYSDGSWSKRNFVGVGNADWGTEDSWRRVYSSEFEKFGKDGYLDYHKTITSLTKAIEETSFDKDVLTVRGSDLDGLSGLLETGNLSFDDAKDLLESGDINALKSAIEGNIYQNHAFTSTAITKVPGAFQGKVYYEVYMSKGTKALYAEPQSYYGATSNGTLYKTGQAYSSVGGESEIILQRGTKFRITSIEKKSSQYSGGSNTYTVRMEVCEQPDYFKYGDEETFNAGATRHKK